MKTLLRIDAGAQRDGSHSRALGDHYQKCWQTTHPGGLVIRQDLAADPYRTWTRRRWRSFMPVEILRKARFPWDRAFRIPFIGEITVCGSGGGHAAQFTASVSHLRSRPGSTTTSCVFGHTITRDEK